VWQRAGFYPGERTRKDNIRCGMLVNSCPSYSQNDPRPAGANGRRVY
jgi:hypothetical protein